MFQLSRTLPWFWTSLLEVSWWISCSTGARDEIPQIVARVSRTVKFYVDFFSFCQDHRFPECVEIFFWVLKKKRFECYQCGCCCYIFYTCLPSFCELGLVFCLLLVALALRYEGNISLSSKSYLSTTIIWTSVKRSKKVEHFKAF